MADALLTRPTRARLVFCQKLPSFFDEIDSEKSRGDFLASWVRNKTLDENLESSFRGAWTDLGYESRTFKAMRPDLPQSVPNADQRYEWKDFFRSDHASFWYPTIISPAVRRTNHSRPAAPGARPSLTAILLTDLGPWRKSYSRCYHSACDDQNLLTDDNLAFMQQVVDSLMLTLMRVGGGRCNDESLADFRRLPASPTNTDLNRTERNCILDSRRGLPRQRRPNAGLRNCQRGGHLDGKSRQRANGCPTSSAQEH